MISAAVRAASVPPFHAMAMARLASELEADGADILHLEVGQPSTGVPALGRAAVEAALDQPLGYTNAAGLESLRRDIAALYGTTTNGSSEDGTPVVTPDRVLIVGGASAGFTLAFLTLFEPGDRVGVIEPGYPCYRNTLLALGVEPVAIPVDDSTRWAPTPELIAAAGPLDGIVLASPSNPTGTVLQADALAAVVDHCAANDIAIVADEIYQGITVEPAPRILEHTQDAFVINSFSKYYSMTGWRIGWVVVPPQLFDTVETLQQNFFICAPHVSQVAARAALGAGDELDGHVRRYLSNREILVDGLIAAGIDRHAPADGAFYVYAHVPHLTTELGIGSPELCTRWLHEAGVSAAPGIDFDVVRGHEYVRFSYAGAGETMARACERLAAWKP